MASYENLQRAFSETSIQSSSLRSMLWPFSALIQVKRVSPLRLFSSCSPLLLVAKIFIALWSYRLCSLFAIEIHAAAFFGFSTLTAAFVVGLFTTAVSGPASFSPPGGYGERFAKLFNDQKAASLVDFADVITLRARTSHQMGNSAFKLSSLSHPCRLETGEEIWCCYRLSFPPKLSRNLLLDSIF